MPQFKHNAAWAGVAVAAALWLLETLIDSWLFHKERS